MADFNFVICGFATLAATVGYACVRKFRPLPSRAIPQHLPSPKNNTISDSTAGQSSLLVFEKSTDESELDSPDSEEKPSDLTSEPIENGSLKRKRAHDPDETDPDMVYPNNLKSIYPNKRRSGSVYDPDQTTEFLPASCDSNDNEEVLLDPPAIAAPDLPDSEPTKPDVVEDSPNPVPDKEEPVLLEGPRFVFPTTPRRIAPFPFTRSTTSPGFANFAGTSSPFFSYSPAKDNGSTATTPIWASTIGTSVVEGTSSSVDAAPADALPALAAAKTMMLATHTYSTGEEEEDIALELKGVKLFVKRGEDNFSGGMVGHIKLLSHKTTLAKRLLFRREPLWKVSMNVRMQPTVRCTFDAQENILRVALKELEGTEHADSSAPQTVIYAFKVSNFANTSAQALQLHEQPSRSCRKGDFQDFAESLLAEAREGGQT
ncbi:hypothetical protein C8R43DRAFT_1125465 [Mycena crocata]|nr:hypothetical protein C8R43DRAFT_1125465 [Mycena crocata]